MDLGTRLCAYNNTSLISCVLTTTYQFLLCTQVRAMCIHNQLSNGTLQTVLLLPYLQDTHHTHLTPTPLWGPTLALQATNTIHSNILSIRSLPTSTRVQDFISSNSSSPYLGMGRRQGQGMLEWLIVVKHRFQGH